MSISCRPFLSGPSSAHCHLSPWVTMGIHADADTSSHSRRSPTQTHTDTRTNKHKQISWRDVVLLNGVSLSLSRILLSPQQTYLSCCVILLFYWNIHLAVCVSLIPCLLLLKDVWGHSCEATAVALSQQYANVWFVSPLSLMSLLYQLHKITQTRNGFSIHIFIDFECTKLTPYCLDLKIQLLMPSCSTPISALFSLEG